MAVGKPCTRMICIRLSEEQYQALQHVCEANGQRSLSNFAREAMDARIHGSPPERSSCECMTRLELELGRLEQKMEDLLKSIQSSLAESCK